MGEKWDDPTVCATAAEAFARNAQAASSERRRVSCAFRDSPPRQLFTGQLRDMICADTWLLRLHTWLRPWGVIAALIVRIWTMPAAIAFSQRAHPTRRVGKYAEVQDSVYTAVAGDRLHVEARKRGRGAGPFFSCNRGTERKREKVEKGKGVRTLFGSSLLKKGS